MFHVRLYCGVWSIWQTGENVTTLVCTYADSQAAVRAAWQYALRATGVVLLDAR